MVPGLGVMVPADVDLQFTVLLFQGQCLCQL